eukprot:4534982-Amphidinium_carterae.1
MPEAQLAEEIGQHAGEAEKKTERTTTNTHTHTHTHTQHQLPFADGGRSAVFRVTRDLSPQSVKTTARLGASIGT